MHHPPPPHLHRPGTSTTDWYKTLVHWYKTLPQGFNAISSVVSETLETTVNNPTA